MNNMDDFVKGMSPPVELLSAIGFFAGPSGEMAGRAGAESFFPLTDHDKLTDPNVYVIRRNAALWPTYLKLEGRELGRVTIGRLLGLALYYSEMNTSELAFNILYSTSLRFVVARRSMWQQALESVAMTTTVHQGRINIASPVSLSLMSNQWVSPVVYVGREMAFELPKISADSLSIVKSLHLSLSAKKENG